MIKVKISNGKKYLNDLLMRQLQKSKDSEYEFFLNEDIQSCDIWIVMHVSGLMKTESVLCNPENTYYFSMEPSENLGNVNHKFLSQFGGLFITDRTVIHPNIIYKNIHTWWVGLKVSIVNFQHIFRSEASLDYEKLTTIKVEKTREISVINSNKVNIPGHLKRQEFINKLKNHPISKYIDFYGYGGINFEDKWQAISPYKYHIVIENSVIDDYWSEKLADSYLGWAFPIYYGCMNIDKYFPQESFLRIDINNFENSVSSIMQLVELNDYKNRIRDVKFSRDKVINDFNVFNIIKALPLKDKNNVQRVTLKPNYLFGRGPKKYLKYIKLLMSKK